MLRVARGLVGNDLPMLRCYVDAITQCGLPVAWTSRRKIDDFERISGGRSPFRPDDLERLRTRVDVLLDEQE